MKYIPVCFVCHGLPKGGKHKSGGLKEGYKLNELAGAISVIISMDAVK